MLVYADRSDRKDPRKCLEALSESLAMAEAQPAGLARHSQLVGILIDAGKLLQGVADANFAEIGADRLSPAAAAISDLIDGLAVAVCRSWDSGFSDLRHVPRAPPADALPSHVDLRVPEGFAFYAVYPEAYIEAARRLKLAGPPRVIGIRSIGTSLAAIVAAAIDAPPPITVRPFGNPFDREIAVAPELTAELLTPGDAQYVIVDEGPGRSGSSFAAVAAWLEGHGITADRIAFVASHNNGPSADATPKSRSRWTTTQRAVADFGERLPFLLAGWAASILGPLEGPPVDVSAGAWRRHVYSDEAAWPAVDPAQERRKYLFHAGGETWLLKFAGLGAVGARKLARARTLHAAGWIPEPKGLAHGFLVERWHKRRRFEPPSSTEIARYLGLRARLLPADPASGASLAELFEMSRRNTELALGGRAAVLLDHWRPRLPNLAARSIPIETDNRLDLHEWLRLPDGRLLKTDALDHHDGHDLIGCQDIAWDVAGAAIEFGLDPPAVNALASDVGRAAGRPVDSELLDFLSLAYLAFRLGQTKLASDTSGLATAEAARLRAKNQAYADLLRQHLHRSA